MAFCTHICQYDYNPAWLFLVRTANFGGGHIPTLVITNHGPRGVRDDTPYNHYSLLRTIEDAFRLPAYLGHAGDGAGGVRPMTPLFAAARPARR